MIGALFTLGKLGFAASRGSGELANAIVQIGVKLGIKAAIADRDAGEEMTELMRSRVPVNSGRLLNGITCRTDGDATVVEASAVRGDFDYARSVEFGHDVSHGDPLGPPRARRSRAEHGGHADAEPFFLSSAQEVFERRGRSLDDAMASSVSDSDL